VPRYTELCRPPQHPMVQGVMFTSCVFSLPPLTTTPRMNPNVLRIVLVLHHPGIQLSRLLRQQKVVETPVVDTPGLLQAQYLRLVLRHARGEFLEVTITHLRLGLHDQAWICIIDPGPPCPFRADRVALRIQFPGVFAEVPDVTGAVLSIIVE